MGERNASVFPLGLTPSRYGNRMINRFFTGGNPAA